MKLKNILIVVKDVEASKKFYRELFGLEVVLNQDGNVILTEGLVLQDENIWKSYIGQEVLTRHNSCELYFEERNLEAFIRKLEMQYPQISYVRREQSISFYDLDGHLIEVKSGIS